MMEKVVCQLMEIVMGIGGRSERSGRYLGDISKLTSYQKKGSICSFNGYLLVYPLDSDVTLLLLLLLLPSDMRLRIYRSSGSHAYIQHHIPYALPISP